MAPRRLINNNPEYIVFGTGASGIMPVPSEIKEYIQKRGIKLIIQKTTDACQTYNALIKEGKKVAAFLHNTC